MKIRLYPTYFWRDTNPVLLRLQEARAGTPKVTHKRLAEITGVSSGTLGRYFGRNKKVMPRRPQFDTILATARGIGPEGVAALVTCIQRDGKQKPKTKRV